jgi:hypothetical protein
MKRINLSFITVEIQQGDTKSNRQILRDARSKETLDFMLPQLTPQDN